MATSRSDWLRWDVARGIGIRRGAHRRYGGGFLASVHAFPSRGSRLGWVRRGIRTALVAFFLCGYRGLGGAGPRVRGRLRSVDDAQSVGDGVVRVLFVWSTG